jgi:hypothetical protein
MTDAHANALDPAGRLSLLVELLPGPFLLKQLAKKKIQAVRGSQQDRWEAWNLDRLIVGLELDVKSITGVTSAANIRVPGQQGVA